MSMTSAQASAVAKLPKVRHNRQESRKLEDWILSQWDRIEKERPTREELSAQVTKALSLACTPPVISSCCVAIGKKYPSPTHASGAGCTMNGTTRMRWRIVISAIINLYQKVGEAIPNELVEFREELSAQEIEQRP